MSKEELIEDLRKRYFEGQREIYLTPDTFKTYEDSVQCLVLLAGEPPPPKPRRELYFKDAIVWTEKDSN